MKKIFFNSTLPTISTFQQRHLAAKLSSWIPVYDEDTTTIKLTWRHATNIDQGGDWLKKQIRFEQIQKVSCTHHGTFNFRNGSYSKFTSFFFKPTIDESQINNDVLFVPKRGNQISKKDQGRRVSATGESRSQTITETSRFRANTDTTHFVSSESSFKSPLMTSPFCSTVPCSGIERLIWGSLPFISWLGIHLIISLEPSWWRDK